MLVFKRMLVQSALLLVALVGSANAQYVEVDFEFGDKLLKITSLFQSHTITVRAGDWDPNLYDLQGNQTGGYRIEIYDQQGLVEWYYSDYLRAEDVLELEVNTSGYGDVIDLSEIAPGPEWVGLAATQNAEPWEPVFVDATAGPLNVIYGSQFEDNFDLRNDGIDFAYGDGGDDVEGVDKDDDGNVIDLFIQ